MTYTPVYTAATERAYAGRNLTDPIAYTTYVASVASAKYFGQETTNEILALWRASVAAKEYQLTYTCLAGLNVGDPVYLSAASTATLALGTTAAASRVIGFVAYKPTTTTCYIDHFRYVTGLAGLTVNNAVYLTDAGGFSATAGTIPKVVGVAVTTTTALLFGSQVMAHLDTQLFRDAEGDPVIVNLTAAADGTSTYAARRDHRHLLDVAIAPTWTGIHTYQSGKFRLSDSDNSNYIEIVTATNEAADRTLTIPALGGNKTLALIDLAQTFTANQTFNGTNGIGIGSTAPATGTNVSLWNIGSAWTQTTNAVAAWAADLAADDCRLRILSEKTGCTYSEIGNGTFGTGAGTMTMGSGYASGQSVVVAYNAAGSYGFVESGNYGTAYTELRFNGSQLSFYLYATSILTLSGQGTADSVLAYAHERTISAGVTDGYNCALRLTPTYTAATAQTVTRHNYIDINNVALAGAGPAALTDACVLRFDAAAGTHKATVGATTKTTPGGVDAWVKININGTLHYIAAYLSTTA